MSFFQKRRWLVEFGVVCLVPIVLIGVFLMQTLQANVQGRALSNAREQARLVADVGLSTPLSGIDDLSHGLTGGQLQAIDRQLGAIRAGNTLQRALIRNREGRVVYANDRSIIGQTNAPAGARNATLGAISSTITSTSQGKMLDVYVPIKIAGAPAAGSAELRFPYAPIAASISSQNSKIKLMLIAGLALLWGTLLTVVTLASQRLRRQAAEKEEQALSAGLPGLPHPTISTLLVQ